MSVIKIKRDRKVSTIWCKSDGGGEGGGRGKAVKFLSRIKKSKCCNKKAGERAEQRIILLCPNTQGVKIINLCTLYIF